MIEDALGAIYIAAFLSIPFLLGLVAGRASKADFNPSDELLGRRVRRAVEEVRFRRRFVGPDFQVVYSGDLTVSGDRAVYRLQIERRDLERFAA